MHMYTHTHTQYRSRRWQAVVFVVLWCAFCLLAALLNSPASTVFNVAVMVRAAVALSFAPLRTAGPSRSSLRLGAQVLLLFFNMLMPMDWPSVRVSSFPVLPPAPGADGKLASL